LKIPAYVFLALMPGLIYGQWAGFAHDAQHTALSTTASQSLSNKHWSAAVDSDPVLSPGGLYAHYGSPIVTAANTVIVPVKTGATGGWKVNAYRPNGTLLYTLPSDYAAPPHNWVPPYGPVLAIRNSLYYPGAAGTVYYRESVDSASGASGQNAFYGNALYNANKASLNAAIQICTPITTDRYGSIYFGFVASSPNPAGVTSGIAKITIAGVGSWAPVSSFGIAEASITQPALNAAPALSIDQKTLYVVAATSGEFGDGYLVSLNSATLAPLASVHLMDPQGGTATVDSDSTASPMVGPDGDVYFGVLEKNICCSHNARGWMLHFSSDLQTTKTPGSFGWDDTASVVPSTLVQSYRGTSSYLILTKYNNYAVTFDGGAGNGVNKVAILDPNASMTDPYTPDPNPVQVMRDVITITGITPDVQPGFPNAVREWCINTVVIDPFTKSALVNSEDGTLYRWDFTTNSFTQKISLTAGLAEGYTPTAIGIDGTVYAINDSILFAVGN
jgi:hypothetical protein